MNIQVSQSKSSVSIKWSISVAQAEFLVKRYMLKKWNECVYIKDGVTSRLKPKYDVLLGRLILLFYWNPYKLPQGHSERRRTTVSTRGLYVPTNSH